MTEEVSAQDVRQRIGGLLERVSLHQDEFIITRKGHPLAALVPVERLEQLRRFARREALRALEGDRRRDLTDDEARELAHEAVAQARKGAAEDR